MRPRKLGKRIFIVGLLLFIPAIFVIAGNTVTIVGELIDDFQFIPQNY